VTRDDLIAFEADIAAEFNAAKIRAPIHLDGGNEDELIAVFADIHPSDWVFCSWRSHYKALLHGIPPEKVKAEIMAGRSISLCFPEHRFFSSAIVGGNLPIALGVAWAIKRAGLPETVYAFLGDMAAMTGMFHECREYARGHGLPIIFVVENNRKSVCTPTAEAWGNKGGRDRVVTFRYELPWPHSGAGKRVEF
jgi:pyruvate dehydrogenase E1 component alpha subunit